MSLMHIVSYAISVIESYALKHLIHCTILLPAYSCAFAIDHAEPESEVQAEQAQAENITNLALDQGKPRYINQCSLSFTLF
jgi:hypothetical protein